MPSTLPEDTSPSRDRAHLDGANHITSEDRTVNDSSMGPEKMIKMNAAIENGDDNEITKDLHGMSFSSNPINGDNAVTDADTAKVSAAFTKKIATNNRKQDNAMKNKAATEEKRKMEEDAANLRAKQATASKENPRPKPTGLRAPPSSVFDPEVVEKLGEHKDALGLSSEQVKEMKAMLGSMTDLEKIQFQEFISQLQRQIPDEELFASLVNGILPRYIAEIEVEVDLSVEQAVDSIDLPLVVKPVFKKGLGALATRNFMKGDEIFREACLLDSTSHSKSWLQVEASLNVISTENKNKFLALAEECGCNGEPCVETRVMRIWYANAFHNYIASFRGEYVYEFASRINHSCIPNSYFSFTNEGHIVFFAAREIKKGEEISQDYKGACGSTAIRRNMLRERYGFICHCTACKANMVVSPAHVMTSFQNGELFEVKSRGTSVMGVYTVAEVAALKLVASWTQKIMTELAKMESTIQVTIMMQAIIGGRTPSADSAAVKEQFKPIERYLKSQNYFDLSDEFFAKFFARRASLVLKHVEQALASYKTTFANYAPRTS